MGLRDRLTPRQVSLFKLAVWTTLFVWIVFFSAFSIVVAGVLAGLAPQVFGVSIWGQVMSWVLPVWYIFTTFLIIVIIARYANAKLRSEGMKE